MPQHPIDRYAVIGQPIAHSKSPLIHRLFAEHTGQAMAYVALEAPLDGFAATARAFLAGGGLGLNVTLPFKLEALQLATERLPEAELAGAANALKVHGDRLLAQNFDGLGLVKDLQQNLRFALAGKRVLLLGAGGASRGALLPLAATGLASLALANRSADKAVQLKAEFAAHVALQAGGYDALGGESFDLVINATSAGLSNARLPLPEGLFAPGALAYDMVYGRGLTPFLAQAQAAGVARLADGVGMLVEQAAEAFAWWRGVRPPTAGVIERLRVPLLAPSA